MAEQIKVIGFSGKAKSGKTTAANIAMGVAKMVLPNEEPRMIGFADPIREFLCGLVGLQPELFSACVDEVQLGTDKTLRYMAQTLGTEWGREMIDKELWIKVYKNKVFDAFSRPGTSLVVTPDVRFVNEAKAIRDLGGVVIRLERKSAGYSGVTGSHKSETEMDGIEADYTIQNDALLYDLAQKVRVAVVEYLYNDKLVASGGCK